MEQFKKQLYKKGNKLKLVRTGDKVIVREVDLGGRSSVEPVYLVEFDDKSTDWHTQSQLTK